MNNSVNKIYYSRENFNLIKDTVKDFFKNNLNSDINNDYDTLIFMTMEYVDKKAGTNVPDNISPDQYMTLLNKKVLKLSLPKIIEKFQSQPNSNQSLNNNKLSNKSQSNQKFNPTTLKNNNNNQYQFFNSFDTAGLKPNLIDPILPHPKPQVRVENNIEDATKKLEFDREAFFARPTNPNFSDVLDIADKEANLKYEKLMNERKYDIDNRNINSPFNINNNINNNNNNNDNSSITNKGLSVEQFTKLNESRNKQIETLAEQPTNINNVSNLNNQTILASNQEIKETENFLNQLNDMTTYSSNNITENININIRKDNNTHNIHEQFEEREKNIRELYEKIKNEKLDGSYPLIPKSIKNNYIKKEFFISINSFDRDFSVYPSASQFRVDVMVIPDSKEFQQVMIRNPNDGNQYLFYQGQIQIQGSQNANILKNIRNIEKLRVTGSIIPNSLFGVYRTLNMPYILLNISEFSGQGPYYGTNKTEEDCFAKLYVVDQKNVLQGHHTNSFYLFTTIGPEESYIYSPAPLASLNSITLTLQDYRNNIIDLGNDKLYIYKYRPLTITTYNNLNPPNEPCSCDTLDLIQFATVIRRPIEIDSLDFNYECLNDERVFFFCENSCYADQFFNINLGSNSNIRSFFRNGYLYFSIADDLIPVNELINTNQILIIKSIDNTEYKARFTGVINDEYGLFLNFIGLTPSNNFDILTILISIINKKGFSGGPNTLNCTRGYNIPHYNFLSYINCCSSDVAFAPDITGDKIIYSYVNAINLYTNIAGFTACGSSNYNFYINGSPTPTNIYTDYLINLDKICPNDLLVHTPAIVSNSGDNTLFSVADIEYLQNQFKARGDNDNYNYYLQTFILKKPKNFNANDYIFYDIKNPDIFLIRQDKQVSYNFTLTSVEPNRLDINSEII
jgi:hypothetical protein